MDPTLSQLQFGESSSLFSVFHLFEVDFLSFTFPFYSILDHISKSQCVMLYPVRFFMVPSLQCSFYLHPLNFLFTSAVSSFLRTCPNPLSVFPFFPLVIYVHLFQGLPHVVPFNSLFQHLDRKHLHGSYITKQLPNLMIYLKMLELLYMASILETRTLLATENL